MCRYVLLVFAESKNQDEFVKVLSEEIVGVADTVDIRYFYGPQSIVLSFSSKESFEDIQEYIILTLGVLNIVYFLIPYNTKHMSYWLTPEVEKHLFGTDKMSETHGNNDVRSNQVLNLLFNYEEGSTKSFDLDWKDIPCIKVREGEELSLDDILDKISKTGMSSLTQHELNLLNNYSK